MARGGPPGPRARARAPPSSRTGHGRVEEDAPAVRRAPDAVRPDDRGQRRRAHVERAGRLCRSRRPVAATLTTTCSGRRLGLVELPEARRRSVPEKDGGSHAAQCRKLGPALPGGHATCTPAPTAQGPLCGQAQTCPPSHVRKGLNPAGRSRDYFSGLLGDHVVSGAIRSGHRHAATERRTARSAELSRSGRRTRSAHGRAGETAHDPSRQGS